MHYSRIQLHVACTVGLYNGMHLRHSETATVTRLTYGLHVTLMFRGFCVRLVCI